MVFMEKMLVYKAESEVLIKNVLKQHFEMSERFIRKLKLNKRIKCNGQNVYLDYKLACNDILTINIAFDEISENIVAENLHINVLYEDEFVMAINKPPNMVVHPTCLHQSHTLANAIQYYLEQKNEKTKIRFVNRLDRDTSGIVVFAKSEYIQECLVKQMEKNIFKKEYIAIVEGIVKEKSGVVDYPIKRDESSIMLRKIAEDGEKAVTHFEVVKELKNNMTLMKYYLETGRTHQIRVHSKAIGHTILGDDLYGKSSRLINRQALHAYKVSFIHPITKEILQIIADIPPDIKSIIDEGQNMLNKKFFYPI